MVLLTKLQLLAPLFDNKGVSVPWEQDLKQQQEEDLDLEAGIPTVASQNFVQDLGGSQCTVDAERVQGRGDGDHETLAMPPCEVAVELPRSVVPGEHVSLPGPHGRRLELEAPPGARPGEALRLRLAPGPELRVKVPLGRGPGSRLRLPRPQGGEVVAVVPEGLQPGDVFETLPPMLMVAAPEACRPGDLVVFQHHEKAPSGKLRTEYLRARVPRDLLFGRYFAARLPEPAEAACGRQPSPPRTCLNMVN